MNFLQSLINKVKGGTTKQPAPVEIVFNQIREQQKSRATQDIRGYKQALAAAESLNFSNRFQLYQLYRNIEMDAHLSSVVQTRMFKAIGKTFRVVDANGKEAKDKTEILKAAWFEDFLKLAWETRTHGYSLIQITGIKDGNVAGVKLVPREHVRPAEKLVVATAGLRDGVSFTDNEWVVGVGSDSDLGLFAKVAPLVLWKQHALSCFAQFVELFGQPYRIGHTNIHDDKRAQAMYNMLADMTSAGFGVMDEDDKLEFMESSKANGDAYLNFLDYLDKQISKLVVGGTMMSDDGSSRSQSEVHERTTDDYVEFDTKFLRYCVNDALLPALTALGIDFAGYTFEFYDEDNVAQLFDMSIKLMQAGQTIDAKWLADKFKIPVVAPATPAAPEADPEAGNFPKPV